MQAAASLAADAYSVSQSLSTIFCIFYFFKRFRLSQAKNSFELYMVKLVASAELKGFRASLHQIHYSQQFNASLANCWNK